MTEPLLRFSQYLALHSGTVYTLLDLDQANVIHHFHK